MRPIKFRWKDKHGKTFYSRLEVSCGCLCLCTASPPSFHGEIDPETVAQLVGYDEDGNEVYEDDLLAGLPGTVSPEFCIEICGDKYSVGEKFNGYKLKEK